MSENFFVEIISPDQSILKSEAKNSGLSNIFLFGYKDKNDCQILSSKIRYNINEVTVMLKGQNINFRITEGLYYEFQVLFLNIFNFIC